jgi:hypothetical protein
MSANETFNADCLSCVGKGQFWVPPVGSVPAGMRCPLTLGDAGTCVGKRSDITCLPSGVNSEAGTRQFCEQGACNSFADTVNRCSVTVCRLEGKPRCDTVPLGVWLPIVCAALWLVNMILVWKFVSARGHKPFPKYVALCFFFGPLVWPYVLYVTRISASSNQQVAKIEELANGQTQPHAQASPYGQPAFNPYGQGLQPAHGGSTVPYGQPQPDGQSAPQGQGQPASFFSSFEVASHSGFKHSGRVSKPNLFPFHRTSAGPRVDVMDQAPQ